MWSIRRQLSLARCVLASALLGPGFAPAAEPASWRWVRLEPSSASGLPTPWIVHQGRSPLALPSTGRFRAELDVDDGTLRQHYVLVGRIAKGRVEARETLQNSDAPSLQYVGEVESGAGGRDRCLNLHHEDFFIHLCGADGMMSPGFK